ncbi:MAG: hypothetical protein SPJ92_09470 [Bariatricus sp.]|nr:hypothetical protein [Bariatricus sp.]
MKETEKMGSAAVNCEESETTFEGRASQVDIWKKDRTLPEIKEGFWTLKFPLKLRRGPGLQYDGERYIETGSFLQIQEIRYLSVSVWGRTKEGWICLYMSGTWYVE